MALMHRLRRDVMTTDELAHADAAPALGPTRLLARPPAGPLGPIRPGGPSARQRTPGGAVSPGGTLPGTGALPPSVARVAARTRLSAELLAAILEVDARRGATLDDIERADALAERLLARRADRQRAAANHPAQVSTRRPAGMAQPTPAPGRLPALIPAAAPHRPRSTSRLSARLAG